MSSWDAKRKIKASTGVCRVLHSMTNVHSDLKRKEDELRKGVMSSALSLGVSSTRRNCGSSKALLPKTLCIELQPINSKESSCCCLFHRQDTTTGSCDRVMADRGLGDPSERKEGQDCQAGTILPPPPAASG